MLITLDDARKSNILGATDLPRSNNMYETATSMFIRSLGDEHSFRYHNGAFECVIDAKDPLPYFKMFKPDWPYNHYIRLEYDQIEPTMEFFVSQPAFIGRAGMFDLGWATYVAFENAQDAVLAKLTV